MAQIPVQGPEKMRWDEMSLLKQSGRKKGYISPPSDLGSIQAVNGLDDAHPPLGRAVYYTEFALSNNNHPEVPSQAYPEIMFNLGTP